DVNIISNAGAIRRRVVGAEDIHFRPPPERRLDRQAGDVCDDNSRSDLVGRYLDPLSLATIHRAESVDGKTAMTFANASAIRRALENAGVELIEENGGGPGARLKQHVSDQTVSRAAS